MRAAAGSGVPALPFSPPSLTPYLPVERAWTTISPACNNVNVLVWKAGCRLDSHIQILVKSSLGFLGGAAAPPYREFRTSLAGIRIKIRIRIKRRTATGVAFGEEEDRLVLWKESRKAGWTRR